MSVTEPASQTSDCDVVELVPNENPVRPVAGVIPQGQPRSSSSLPTCSSMMNEIRRCTSVQGDVFRRQISQGRAEAAHSAVASGSFRRPVVRSDGADRRPAAALRLAPLPATEWNVERASPSPTRDAFSIGDSKRNTN
jgi:hypothetical protein